MNTPLKLCHFQTPYPNPHDFGSWRACAGVARSEEMNKILGGTAADRKTFTNRLVYCSQVDQAWVICLWKAGVLDQETTATLLNGLQTLLDSGEFAMGGENSLIPVLGGDEDLASLINLGRTMQEPMSRLQLRDMLINFFGFYFDFMETLLAFAKEHRDAIMPGHTHFSQANPITLANYILSVYDCMERGLDQLELSYKLINKNSGGCGATSGTVWPVDRHLMTRLLGMDDLLEVTYDCEASQDHTMHLMFSIANIVATLSKMTMDMEIWGLEEIGMVFIDPSLAGVSSMMPQKCHNGEINEHLRDKICTILGDAATGLMRIKGEPHGDVLAMYFFPEKGLESLIQSKEVVRRAEVLIRHVQTRPETMLRLVKEGYSCMTEVVVHLVREKGYGGRRAHRMCAYLTRMAREQGIKATELTGGMLDEAARNCGEEPPKLSTESLQNCLDPVSFIENHNHTGGPAPSETLRMVEARRKRLAEARDRQQARIGRIAQGRELLSTEIADVCTLKS